MQFSSPPSARLKTIRVALGYSIDSFARALEYPEYENIENNTGDLPGKLIIRLLQVFSINPLWLYSQSNSRFIDITHNTSPKYIMLTSEGNERILMVNQKASAGYPQNLYEEEWYQELPSMDIPLNRYRNATYRGFQVKGDSMMPNLQSGDWVIGKAVESIQRIRSGKIYIIVLKDAVVVKQVIIEDVLSSHELTLRSLNQDYEDLHIASSGILELWEVSSKLTFSVNVSQQNNLRKELEDSMRSFFKP